MIWEVESVGMSDGVATLSSNYGGIDTRTPHKTLLTKSFIIHHPTITRQYRRALYVATLIKNNNNQ